MTFAKLRAAIEMTSHHVACEIHEWERSTGATAIDDRYCDCCRGKALAALDALERKQVGTEVIESLADYAHAA